MERISAKNPAELRARLQNLSAAVAKRGKGQTTEQTELWMLSQLGRAWADFGLIEFPVEILRGDRPDVRLEMTSGSVGLELTEVVPPVYAQADAICNKHYPGAQVSRSVFTWGAHFTAEQIHLHLSQFGSKLTGSPWFADSVEREWASAVNESIKVKTEKLNKSGFTIYSRNWLCAYTSSPGPALKVPSASKLLGLPTPSQGEYHFDAVFVLAGRKLVALKEGAFKVYDLAQE